MLPVFVAFVALELLLVVLDVWDLRRECRDRAKPPTFGGPAIFLGGVTLLFLGIQGLGSSLVPGTGTVLQSMRQLFVEGSDAAALAKGGTASLWTTMGLSVALFYTAGFWDYAVHRGFSHSRWFFFTHEYHHLPKHVCVLMPGILARPFAFLPSLLTSILTGITLYGGLAALGLPLWDPQPALPALLVIVLVLTASHSSFLRRRPLVHRVLRCAFLTTPQEHLLHHAVQVQGNYGNFTTLWDRLFGTYVDPAGIALEQVPLGLPYDQDFLGTVTLGLWKLPPGVRRRFDVGRFCNLDSLVETQRQCDKMNPGKVQP